MSSAPLPSDSAPFTFSCQCLNVSVQGRIPLAVEKIISAGTSKSNNDKQSLQQLYIDQAETIVRYQCSI